MCNEDKNIRGSLILDVKKMMTSQASQEYILSVVNTTISVDCVFLK